MAFHLAAPRRGGPPAQKERQDSKVEPPEFEGEAGAGGPLYRFTQKAVRVGPFGGLGGQCVAHPCPLSPRWAWGHPRINGEQRQARPGVDLLNPLDGVLFSVHGEPAHSQK